MQQLGAVLPDFFDRLAVRNCSIGSGDGLSLRNTQYESQTAMNLQDPLRRVRPDVPCSGFAQINATGFADTLQAIVANELFAGGRAD